MKKGVKRKKIYRNMLLCVLLLCLTGMNAAGCGKKSVSYVEDEVKDEQESTDTDARRTLDADGNGENRLWDEVFTVDRENGDTATVKVKMTVREGPDTSQVIEVKRMTLDESVKERITKAVFEDGVSVEDGVYTGNRDGIPYRMRIGENRISLYPADITQVVPKELADMASMAPEGVEKPYEFMTAWSTSYTNNAKLSEKEAVKIAGQFLEDIGLSDRNLCNVKSLEWQTTFVVMDEETVYAGGSMVDGYVLYFEQTLQGETATQLTDDTDSQGFWTWQEGDETSWIEDTRMHTVVCVNDHGVVAADIQNIYEITSVKEDVSLLPVETIQGIMQNELTRPGDCIAKATENYFYYWGMDYGYCLLWDETGKNGSYVPVCELLGRGTGETDVTVNMIDGSIITREQKEGASWGET